MPTYGAESITVPGALSGWAELLEHYGTITLAQALGPAIRLAEEGFPVSPIIAQQWADETERLEKDEGARATFLIDGVRAPQRRRMVPESRPGPDLPCDRRAVGPAVLYGGELGQVIVNRVQALGGFLTLEDLMGQQANWVEPISVPFKGYRVWELPPNNQGVAVLEMLADSRALRPRRVGPQFGAVSPPPDRGQEARLRRSRAVRGGSRAHEDPGLPALLRRVHRSTPVRADRPPTPPNGRSRAQP